MTKTPIFQLAIYFILIAWNQEHLHSHSEVVAKDISKKFLIITFTTFPCTVNLKAYRWNVVKILSNKHVVKEYATEYN